MEESCHLAGEEDETTLSELLKDEVFVDFFNTFLNLPVFGQTPLYLLRDNKWILCPDILHSQQVNGAGFLQWLTSQRLTLFKQTELFHHYLLCAEILQLPSSQTKEGQPWTKADQWLLRRCVGSVRGLQRFSSFMAGTRGEELVLFSVRVNRLLSLAKQEQGTPPSVHYRGLLSVIQLNHLREGSGIIAACRISPAEALEVLAGNHPETGKLQLLWRMRAQAMRRLQDYWLPHFLSHCKASLARVVECRPLVEEYVRLASCDEPQEAPVLPGTEWSRLERSVVGPSPYNSKQSKKLLWRSKFGSKNPYITNTEGVGQKPTSSVCQWLSMDGKACLDGCTSIAHNKDSDLIRPAVQPSGTDMSPGGFRPSIQVAQTGKDQPLPDVDVPHVCMGTPALHVPAEVDVPTSPPAARRHAHMGPALSADEMAGGPYRAFLETRALAGPLLHLALWRELDVLLSLLLKAQSEDSLYAQKQAVARRIADAFFSREVERTLGVESGTCAHLRELLPSGQAIPWIYAAKHDICKFLSTSYDSFLDEEDKTFIIHLFGRMQSVCLTRMLTVPSSGWNTAEQQLRHMTEALALCHRCCGYTDAEPLSDETWVLLTLEDVAGGGSIHLHYKKTDVFDMPFEQLALKFPKVAAERISVSYHLYCKERPPSDRPTSRNVSSATTTRKDLKKANSFYHTASMRPRTYGDLFRNSTHLDYFKRYLRYNNTHGGLLFIQEVERLRSIDQTPKGAKIQKRKIHTIVEKYFRRDDATDFLQCSADIINKVGTMRTVTCEILYTIQDVVNKSLEAAWFKQYQDIFPACSTVVPDTTARESIIKSKLKNVWTILSGFIKGVCKFKAGMANTNTRSEFEQFLHQQYLVFSDPCGVSRSPSSLDMSKTYTSKEDDTAPLKTRLINDKPLIVDFLVNDLSFYLECERFRSLADSGKAMAVAGLYGENDYAMLHQKADMIIKLFLKSEFSPKLRINIAEFQRDSILQLFYSGRVDRTLFYLAIVTVFPILMICWKKFCAHRVMKKLFGEKAVKTPKMGGQKAANPEASPDHLEVKDIKDDWYHKVKTIVSLTDEHTIVRFTVQRGLKLIVPQNKVYMKECPGSDLLSKIPSGHRGLPAFGAPDSLGLEAPPQKQSSNTHLQHPEGAPASGVSLLSVAEEL
ncbi:regulator of G-protein signaling protein-like isoform X1 [Alosa sapidissima]|uniref:regulator of G-protein signaling protein-like isoform X1 n=1 Tax=Alosa sapidissima TaxID=34773 RepID=UPI001C0931AC|nr:regulator of G-protein signaling protein-like isoform X1 [Alosa sapidissima]